MARRKVGEDKEDRLEGRRRRWPGWRKEDKYASIPADGQVSLCGQGHGQVGVGGHQDVLHGVPEVGEHIGVEVGVELENLVWQVVGTGYSKGKAGKGNVMKRRYV